MPREQGVFHRLIVVAIVLLFVGGILVTIHNSSIPIVQTDASESDRIDDNVKSVDIQEETHLPSRYVLSESTKEVPAMIVSYRYTNGTFGIAKFIMNSDDGKFHYEWNLNDMRLGGINDTDQDGSLEVYAWYIEPKGSYYEFSFYKIDEQTGDIEWIYRSNDTQSDYYRFYQFEDFNNDGIYEALIGKQFKNSIRYLWILNSTDGTPILEYDGGNPKLWSYPIMYDYNNDGVRDVIFYGWPDDTNTYFRVVSFKNFNQVILDEFYVPTWGLSHSNIADFDHDGQPEWIIGGWGSSYWRLYETDHSVKWSVSLEGSADGNYLIVDELVGQGLVAIGTGSYSVTTEYVHVLNTTTGEDVFPAVAINGNSLFPAGGVFDLNKDGTYELLSYYGGNDVPGITLIDLGTGNQLFTIDSVALSPYYWLVTAENGHSYIDIDKDGYQDLTMVDFTGEINRVYYNGSTSSLGTITEVPDIDLENHWIERTMFYWTQTKDAFELREDAFWNNTFVRNNEYFMYNYDGLGPNEIFLTERINLPNNSVFVYSYNYENKDWNLLDTLQVNFSAYHMYVNVIDLDNDTIPEYLIHWRESTTSGSINFVVCHQIDSTLYPITNTLTFADGIYDIEFYDLDNDGVLEIGLICGYYESSAFVYRYTGSQLVQIWTVHWGGCFGGSLEFLDIDNDGQIELAVSNSYSNIEFYDWTGSSFSYKTTLNQDAAWNMVAIDYDNDGIDELVTIGWKSYKIIYTYDWDGSQIVQWTSPDLDSNTRWISCYYNVSTNKYDILILTEYQVYLMHWNGSTFVAHANLPSLSHAISAVSAAVFDVDGDSFNEFVYGDRSPNDPVEYFTIEVIEYSYATPSLDTNGPLITLGDYFDAETNNTVVWALINDTSSLGKVIASYSYDNVSWINVTMHFNRTCWIWSIDNSSNNTIYYYVKAKDAIGNWATSQMRIYGQSDTTPPSITMAHAPNEPQPDDDVTVSAEITDASPISQAIMSYSTDGGSTWTNVSMTLGINWTAQIPAQPVGTDVQYKVYAEDSAGNWGTSSVNSYVVVDTNPPTIVTSRSPLAPTYNDDVTVYANVSDASSINQAILSYSTDGGASWTNVSMGFTVNWSAIIPTQSSGTTVQYKVYAEDAGGNWGISATDQYTVDDVTPPDIYVFRDPINPTINDAVQIIAMVMDSSGSSEAILSYSIDAGITWINVTMTYIGYDNFTQIIDAQSAGTWVYYKVYADDSFGNWNVSITYSYQVIDKQAPNFVDIWQDTSAPFYNESLTVYANVTDDSGVNQVILSYSIDGGLSWTNISMTFNDIWNASIPPQSADTNITYFLYAEDGFGNWATSNQSWYVVLDYPYPEIIEVAISPNSPTELDEVSINLTISDTSLVIQVILSYSIDKGSTWTNTTMVYSTNYTANISPQTAGTTVQFMFYIQDTIGRWTYSVVYNYTVGSNDSSPPTVSTRISPSIPTSDDLVIVSANVDDPNGISQVILSYSTDSGSSWTNVSMNDLGNGTYTGIIPNQPDDTTVLYRVYAADAFGNWEITSIESYTVDDSYVSVDVIWSIADYGSQGFVTIVANITDGSQVSYATLFYTKNNWTAYFVVNYTYSQDTYTWTFWIQNNETILFKIVICETSGKTTTIEDGPIAYGDFEVPTILADFDQYIYIEDAYCSFIVTDLTEVDNVIILYSFDGDHWIQASVSFNGTGYLGELDDLSVGVTIYIRVEATDVYGNTAFLGPLEVIIAEQNPPNIVYIYHYPDPVYANETIMPIFEINDDTSLSEFYVIYSTDLTNWTRIDLVYNESLYYAEIPGKPAGTYIYFLGIAVDIFGNENRTEMVSIYVQEGTAIGNVDDWAQNLRLILSVGITTLSFAVIIYFLIKILKVRRRGHWASNFSNP